MPENRSARLVYALFVCVALIIIGRNMHYQRLNKSLMNAVEAKDVAAVRALLIRGADPNTKQTFPGNAGKAPQLAPLDLVISSARCSGTEQEIACLLIEYGANIKEDAEKPESYLGIACQNGALPVVRCLLQHGANVGFKDRSQITPSDQTMAFVLDDSPVSPVSPVKHSFHTIERPQRPQESLRRLVIGKEIFHLLQQKGVQCASWQAIIMQDNVALHTALDIATNVNAALPIPIALGFGKGYSLLHVASYCGNKEAVQLLLQRGGDVNALNAYDHSPLYLAIYKQHREIAALLLAHGADVNSSRSGSEPPFVFAVSHMPALVPELLRHHVDLKTLGVPALCAAIYSRHSDMVTLLLHQGIRCQGQAGYKALSAAIRFRPDLVPLLLAQGADARETVQQDRSLLWEAIHYNREELVLPLLRAGANVNASENNITPLVEAIGKRPSLVKALLEMSADPNKVVSFAPTALSAAAQSGKIEAAKLLVLYGANINQTSKLGHTALYYARKHHAAEIVALLSHGGGQEE